MDNDASDAPAEGLRERSRPLTQDELKALAHPLRFRLLELLRDAPATASALGRAVGESSGTTSYHLRKLAAAGLIEDAPDVGDGRDRWWRARPVGWSLDRELTDDPRTAARAGVVLDEALTAQFERLRQWRDTNDRWPAAWRDATVLSTNRLALNAEEMAELGEALLAVVERFRDRDPAVEGRARVVAQVDLFPLGDPPADPDERGS